MVARLEIVILEDARERRKIMAPCLADLCPEYEVRFFHTAGETISYLIDNLSRVLLICLDHDLEMIPIDGHRLIDPGSGRDVADFLATREACCPIVIHSTNGIAVEGMKSVLGDAGWSIHRIVPVGVTRWIRKGWRQRVCDAFAEAGVSVAIDPEGS
ncbi:MAG: hypothetical protein H8E37_08055 [Planctomycetes bacterium]|nr:hypothetical protein [Planctomycetota bacterium]